jgi:hypothetical protein
MFFSLGYLFSIEAAAQVVPSLTKTRSIDAVTDEELFFYIIFLRDK